MNFSQYNNLKQNLNTQAKNVDEEIYRLELTKEKLEKEKQRLNKETNQINEKLISYLKGVESRLLLSDEEALSFILSPENNAELVSLLKKGLSYHKISIGSTIASEASGIFQYDEKLYATFQINMNKQLLKSTTPLILKMINNNVIFEFIQDRKSTQSKKFYLFSTKDRKVGVYLKNNDGFLLLNEFFGVKQALEFIY